jgi:hypothetical protein
VDLWRNSFFGLDNPDFTKKMTLRKRKIEVNFSFKSQNDLAKLERIGFEPL